MKWQSGPLVDDPRPGRRTLKTLGAFLRHPRRSTLSWRTRNWHQRISVLTVMQHAGQSVAFRYRRSPLTFGDGGCSRKSFPASVPPAYLPVANRRRGRSPAVRRRAAERAAGKSG